MLVRPSAALAVTTLSALLALPTPAHADTAAAPSEATRGTSADARRPEASAVTLLAERRLAAAKSDAQSRERALVELGEAARSYVALAQPERPRAVELLRESLNAYRAAASLSLEDGRIRYTQPLKELAVELGDPTALQEIFARFLQTTTDEKGLYLARVDLADGLAKLADPAAESYFRAAIGMRPPVDSAEAHIRYAKFLKQGKRPAEALGVLSRFDEDARFACSNVAFLRHNLMRELNLDTAQSAAEVARIQSSRAGTPGRVATSILDAPVGRTSETPTSGAIGLLAGQFSHTVSSDDSRDPVAAQKFIQGNGFMYAPYMVNVAEVIWNESRGESQNGQIAIGWGIRNRRAVNIRPCDAYIGSESNANTPACRAATPSGPQPEFTDLARSYSCVVHGGTTAVGASHDQMNDGHVSLAELENTCIMDTTLDTLADVYCDTTTFNLPIPVFCPDFTFRQGNPRGGQEWLNFNYCAARPECKVRLGNPGGTLPDPGSPCPARGAAKPGEADNWFWGPLR